ncbi:MAG TPA: hypothetical protein VGA22_03390 [Gemmatimonadales bacterium]|jgi:hypothetical protein
MPKRGETTDTIQDLLKEKQRIEQWLDRLDNAADQTKNEVRERVAKDYRTRLDGVVANLQGFRGDLADALQEQQERRAALTESESQASERLAEAELRHAVGEYDEATWSKLRTDILEELVGIRGELKSVRNEVETLDAVIRLIDAPPTPRPAEEPAEPELAVAEAPEAPPAPPEPERRSVEVPEIPLEQEDLEPAHAKPSKAAQGEFDELAFLKSVTESQSAKPAPPEAPKGKGAKKTLVCSECGANNLPTEWYCERCGAELASL